MTKTQTTEIGSTVWVATELRFLGKATITEATEDGNLIVTLTDGRKGKVATDQIFATKKEALLNTQTPMNSGWASAAQLLV